jgi:beta-galactosidase
LRSIIPFNHGWLFTPHDVDRSTPDSRFEPVTLPHSNKILPHHNFDNAEYQFVSTYRKRFRLPEPLNGRRLYLDFDGAMVVTTVFVNGAGVGTHAGGYTPFSFDITDCLTDGENLLEVKLDSTERPDVPPFGFVVDYLTFGGIYREVNLRYVEPCHITDVFVRPKDVLKEPKLEVDVTLANQSAKTVTGLVSIVLDSAADLRSTVEMYTGIKGKTVTVPPGGETTLTLQFPGLSDTQLWTLDNPHLQHLEVLFQPENHDGPSDRVETRFGLREAHFEKDGFYLNGEKIKLIGLNRHQTYPYIGAAAPARLQRKDAEIVKYELGCNIVRTSHYPQSKYFLDRCDEIGLLVFEEIPGWQHVGDEDWQAISLRDVEAMILRDRNHPAIVLWGVRINESQDNETLYRRTNDLAHKLDPTRQTGGVRFFQSSQFLEDVFTYNDFSNTVVEPEHTPHLVTEFNGHMFPTKTWDQEERQMEHALRHARIQDKQLGMPNVTGAIGWCAFDYNTHREFGSGDRICYHGVSDIFRLPKYAAYFYESQIPPERHPVLRAATIWSMGDRSGGGNDPLIIFSNLDEIDVYVGENLFGRFQPDRTNFPHLPHPPFRVEGLQLWLTWGQALPDLRVVGFLKGQAVAEQRVSAHGIPEKLLMQADDAELIADGADMTRLVFKITDRFGNRLPYATQVISFEIDGPGELIGENPFALVGGQAALYVKAKHEPGTVRVRATTPRLEDAEVTIKITSK